MATDFDPLLLEKAAQVQLLLLDVDGVMTDGRLYFSDSGDEFKTFNSRDGLGIKAVMHYGIKVGIISGRSSVLLENRCRQLGIEHLYQGQDNKLIAYRNLLDKLELSDQQVCYCGDDWIDLPVLQRVGLAVCVADADAELSQRCHWVTQNKGGRGAVREICLLLLQSRGKAQHWLDTYLKAE